MKNILESASVKRLQGILKARYGTGLQVELMTDISSGNLKTCLHDGVLEIPIFSEGRFLAKAILPSAEKISFDDFDAVSDLVKMVLEPVMSNWVEEQHNYSIETAHGQILHADNVFPLFELPEIDAADDEIPEDRIQSFLTSVIYLETKNPLRLPRIVSEIHDISRRWACLPFEQIQADITCSDDIQQLGALTLVVNDVLNISPEKRSILADYLRQQPSNEMPLIIVSSGTPLRELISQEIIDPEFAQQIQKCVLEADRLPQKLEVLRETLELFLEPGAIL